MLSFEFDLWYPLTETSLGAFASTFAFTFTFTYPLSPFLIRRTVSSPKLLRTERRTILRFLIELRRTFRSPNLVRTVRRTILRFVTELRRTFRSPNLVRTVRRTILRFLFDLQWGASFVPNLRKCSRPQDPQWLRPRGTRICKIFPWWLYWMRQWKIIISESGKPRCRTFYRGTSMVRTIRWCGNWPSK